jgi:hypothetical protein
MVSLNLSYEESKQVQDLGYDFSPVCTKFELRTDVETQIVYGTLATRGKHTEIISSDSVNGIRGEAHRQHRTMFNVDMVPIIPKAALENCLPDIRYDGVKYRWVGHTLISGHYLDNKKSALKAFLWCHTDHQEALKAEFENYISEAK